MPLGSSAKTPEWLEDAWSGANEFWNYELFSIEGQGLGIGRLILGTALLVFGVAASRRLSRMLSSRLMKRFNMSLNAAALLQALAFYLLLTLFTLTALRLANVPLTVFAVLGGALAIGIGFGSQAVVNNFISGLILMIEQPVKAGDIIEVEGTYGMVQQIGARSTIVRTPTNMHIVIPNSSLLEKPVSNWTLSDQRIRAKVSVGVAYGSDARLTESLLLQAAAEHDDILEEPAPQVFFVEFGDNALAFELDFWVRMSSMADRRRCESNVRFSIDRLFADAGIEISFPQRDVHLDTSRPLEIKLLGK